MTFQFCDLNLNNCYSPSQELETNKVMMEANNALQLQLYRSLNTSFVFL